ncbi:hypothetical protein NBRC116584_29260 [Hydrogenophaga sp. 5NK40-0174]
MPIPLLSELGDEWVSDGGTWTQPFPYGELAHLIIPHNTVLELWTGNEVRWEAQTQDINRLAEVLKTREIEYVLSELVLELKLY